MYDIYHGCPSHDLLEALLDHSVLTSWKKPKTIQQTPDLPVECLAHSHLPTTKVTKNIHHQPQVRTPSSPCLVQSVGQRCSYSHFETPCHGNP